MTFYNFRGGNFVRIILSAFLKSFSPNGKKLLPLEAIFFFPFKVYTFSKGTLCIGQQKGSHKIVSIVKEVENQPLQEYPVPSRIFRRYTGYLV